MSVGCSGHRRRNRALSATEAVCLRLPAEDERQFLRLDIDCTDLKLGEREVAAVLLGLTAEDWKRRGNMSHYLVSASAVSMRGLIFCQAGTPGPPACLSR